MFDRNRDPNNLEELMVSEFMSNKDRIKELEKILEEHDIAAAADHDELIELLQAEEDKTAHLEEVLAKEEGIVDLHQPLLLYRSDIASYSYFKQWLDEYAEEISEDDPSITSLIAYQNALTKNDSDCLEFFKNKGHSYWDLCKLEKKTFKYSLQIPLIGVVCYDPNHSRYQLVVPDTNYKDESWCDMPLEEFKKAAAKRLRENANKALAKYLKEQEEKDGQNVEETS